MQQEQSTGIDIFISRKSEDAHLAKRLYQYFVSLGWAVFDSDEALPKMGNTDYLEQIDRALESCQHLIVVGSTAANIQSRWVQKEWSSYINEKLSGRKNGNLLTVVTSGLKIEELPISLRNYQVLELSVQNMERIAAYVQPGKKENHFGPTSSPVYMVSEMPDPKKLLRRASEEHTTDFGNFPTSPGQKLNAEALTNGAGEFLVNGDGTLTDQRRGLMWIRAPWGLQWNGRFFSGNPIRVNWKTATKLFGRGTPVLITQKDQQDLGDGAFPPACLHKATFENGYTQGTCRINFAGYQDWRLPTADEFAHSIIEPFEQDGEESNHIKEKLWGNVDPNSPFYNPHFWNGFFWTANERCYRNWTEKLGIDQGVAWKAAPSRRYITDDRKEVEYFVLFVRNLT